MTRNEYLINMLMESADLLEESCEPIVLTEGIIKTSKAIEEINNDNSIPINEKRSAIKWFNNYGDKIEDIITDLPENYKKSGRNHLISTLISSILGFTSLPIWVFKSEKFGILSTILSILGLTITTISMNVKTSKISMAAIRLRKKLEQINKSDLSKKQQTQYDKIMDRINALLFGDKYKDQYGKMPEIPKNLLDKVNK